MDLRPHDRTARAIGIDALRQRTEIVGDEPVAQIDEAPAASSRNRPRPAQARAAAASPASNASDVSSTNRNKRSLASAVSFASALR